MIVRENVSLKELTTFKVGGSVPFVMECMRPEDVAEALSFAQEKQLPWYVLGEGSNMVPSEQGFEGVVLLMRDTSLVFSEEKDGIAEVRSGAGVIFDVLVSEAVERGLWGLENLAGIPGTVGAAPVQNIGAYGSEIAQVFSSVEVFDTTTKTRRHLSKEECEFSYRESIFKQTPNLIILNVTLMLSSNGTPNISYPDLRAVEEKGVRLATPAEIAEAVRSIRRNKFPDWKVYGTAGSFFKNPIISKERYATLQERYGDIPQYPAGDSIKIPLAFILDKILGLKGYRKGRAWLFERQPLVLVTEPDATADEIEILAADVSKRVFDATDISIEREPRSFTK